MLFWTVLDLGSNRAQLAEPPTLSGSVEYSYAYDHLLTNQSTEIHTYDYVDDGEGSSHYFKSEPRKTSSAEKGGVTEDVKETQGQEVPVKEEDDEVTGEDERTIGAVVEETDSSSGVRSIEGIDNAYFALIPTEEQNTQNEASGYEVAAVPHDGDVASSSTEVITQKGDNNTYFPLIPNNTDHKSPNEQSDGYEVAGVMQPSKNEQSEFQPPGCSCLSPNTVGAERTTHYDHLVRGSNKAIHDGALSDKIKTTATNI